MNDYQANTNFDNIKFILVQPSHPGNIGAVARAMKTMAFTHLTIVSPVVSNPLQDAEAIARSAGAADIIQQTLIVDSLEKALVGVHWSLALSARTRKFGPDIISPRAAAMQLVDAFNHKKIKQAAIIFGNEQSGLSNYDLGCSQIQVKIPANQAYSSLNLASAAQIIAYELHIALIENEARKSIELVDVRKTAALDPFNTHTHLTQTKSCLASHDELNHLHINLEKALVAINFVNPHHPKKLLPRLQQIIRKTQLQSDEVKLLQGIIKALLNKFSC